MKMLFWIIRCESINTRLDLNMNFATKMGFSAQRAQRFNFTLRIENTKVAKLAQHKAL
jgi:hypothetical protein